MLVLAHISDLHLDGSARATERAERVRDHLWGLPGPVDALLVTGDIADHAAEPEYEEAARLLGLREDGGSAPAPFPVLTCPGNHDSRAPYRKALLGQEPSGAPVNSVRVFEGGAVLMCDSSVPGEDDGALEEETYAWIEATLDDLGGRLPVLLAFHHPPVALHHPLPDSYQLGRPEALAALMERRPEIAGLITGHAHTPAATSFAGRPLVVGPGVTWTLRLPWEGEQIADRDAPVGLAFHILTDDGRLTSHFRVV
ncbi:MULTISPECIES: metallophosphoesterase [Streptomyces]|uniref:Metallophosphoesterase n=2 Tax=Streptomyces TaxID=1883 RepID=A0A2U9P8L1_STRAS|nr:metallophosphoesterase [Streptomyces actuosus]AWT46090.1 metallophosphoesterase [Streptomyces actuosus]MBM4822753.1 metallophosphoesterase [Streptomyces actuosus]